MRVCISYTHLYPIKSLNHTSPSRKCKLCFWANIQVTSTTRHKITEIIRAPIQAQMDQKWCKNQIQTSQDRPNPMWTRQGGPEQPVWRSWGRLAPLGRRPTTLVVGQARGPHRLIQAMWCLLIGLLGRLQGSHPVAPYYKYKGVEIMTHTPHFLSSMLILHSL